MVTLRKEGRSFNAWEFTDVKRVYSYSVCGESYVVQLLNRNPNTCITAVVYIH